jgi:hypothetical protein
MGEVLGATLLRFRKSAARRAGRSGGIVAASGPGNRFRHRSAAVLSQKIVDRLDHQGLDGRVSIKR